MKNNYLLESSDSLSLQKEIDKIIIDNNFKNEAISTYDITEQSLEKPLEDLDTYSFLTTKKVIIINNIDKLNQEENKKDIKHLFSYLDNSNPDNLLVITSKKLNNVLKITKELKKKCEFIEISLDPNKFIKNELKDYKLENGVVKELEKLCLGDITKIYNECQKLKTYKYEEQEIKLEDVKELVQEKLGDATELTFEFAKSIASRNKKNALIQYNKLLNYNIEPLSIIGLLSSQLRIMYQVSSLLDKNYTNNQIADILEEKPFRIMKTRELVHSFTKKEIRKLMIELSDMDLKIKTTDVEPDALIQVFILNL